MNFLVDAQLPRRLARRLLKVGHDTRHTLDLPDGNRTTDNEICDIAEREQRIVITKDADFVNSFLLARRPSKLLLVSTGNANNTTLERLFFANLEEIVNAFQQYDFVELTHTAIIIHM
jgi:predicted nuclease of predicted toxin-antitoxin system